MPGNRKVDPEILLNYRLAPDMLPFIRQIQIAADLAKGAVARRPGVEVPNMTILRRPLPISRLGSLRQ
jgi:hypothetical protein